MQYAEIREELSRQGFELSDEEFAQQVAYARRKAEVAGKDESYISLLLPDVIKEYFMRAYINTVTAIRMGLDFI